MSNSDSHEKKNRPRILLVDDTEINRDVIGGILSAADFNVDYACDGEAAYQAAWGTSYDLILMDIEMPGMNGFEVAARIRAREGVMSGVTIAALTATNEPDAKHYSFCSGIDEFISRPIPPRALVHRVLQIISDHRSSDNDWKPVWRLGVFSKFTERLDESETRGYIEDLISMLTDVASSIDTGSSRTEDFSDNVRELLTLSSLLGFDEVAGICQFYSEPTGSHRNRDPNLLGAVNRARFAIKSYIQDEDATLLTTLWAKARSNLHSLIGGTRLIETAM